MNIDIGHLAKLSKLRFSKEEEDRFLPQMKAVIEMVEKLPALQGSDSLLDPANPMKCREDIARNHYNRDEILSNAPQLQAGCVVVPKVIE